MSNIGNLCSPIELYQGSTYTFNSWDCNTTFTEYGLPSSEQWYAVFGGTNSNTVATGSTATVTQSNIATISTLSATAYSNTLDCASNSKNVEQGTASQTQLGTWSCVTDFQQIGMNYGSGTYYVNFNGTDTSSVAYNTVTSAVYMNNMNVVNALPATAYSNNYNCYTPTSNVYPGSPPAPYGQFHGYVVMTNWRCITTFNSGLPSQYSGLIWQVSDGGNSAYGSATSPLQLTFTSSSFPATYSVSVTGSSTQASSAGKAFDCSTSASVPSGQTYSFSSSDWTCYDKFYETGLPTGYTWSLTFGGVTGSASSGSSITLTTNAGYFGDSAKAPGLSCSPATSFTTPAGTSGLNSSFGESGIDQWDCTNYLYLTSGSPFPSSTYTETATNNFGFSGDSCSTSYTLNWQNNRTTLPNGDAGLIFQSCPIYTSNTYSWSICGSGGTTSGCATTILGTCGDAGLFSRYEWTPNVSSASGEPKLLVAVSV